MELITAHGLRKSYGTREVLHGIDLTVEEGEIVGVLGPNGAGKTTAVECIGGLRVPDGGRVRIAGIDPTAKDSGVRHILGMQLQQCRLPAKITPAEALDLFAAFYPNPRRSSELLKRFGLSRQANQRFENLSGGQQQRLSIALALVGRPKVAILDELTTGLDPAARRNIWTFLEGLAGEGMTILLVTHSMEEAAHLCDRVYIIDDGRVVASGRTEELATGGGSQSVTFVPSAPLDPADLLTLPGVTSATIENHRVTVLGDSATPQAVLAELITRGITAEQLRITGPTLDDAYLHATQENRS
ncbi:MAG: ABC transporter ATP-binding protein [Ruaniaceae bacterium]|nr:ABC transporter ATP-binding protein [Ruaniaceae bacterium]